MAFQAQKAMSACVSLSLSRVFPFAPKYLRNLSTIRPTHSLSKFSLPSSSSIARSKSLSLSTSADHHPVTASNLIAQHLQHRQMKIGQPTPDTHPFLLKKGEVTVGIQRDEYKSRRDRLMDSLPPQSLVILSAGPLPYMSNDIPYVYRQHSDLFYLTGTFWKETFRLKERDFSLSFSFSFLSLSRFTLPFLSSLSLSLSLFLSFQFLNFSSKP